MKYERIDISAVYEHLIWSYVFSLYVIAVTAYLWTVLKEFMGRK